MRAELFTVFLIRSSQTECIRTYLMQIISPVVFNTFWVTKQGRLLTEQPVL